jgi:hypothetical protein
MTNSHPASLSPEQLLAQCDQRFTRRSGPGGQNRNKVETAVILRHRPTGYIAEANEKRTQGENRQQALFRLRILMALEIRGSLTDSPTDLWRSRCRGGKLSVNPAHDDFPALLAEALDALEHFNHNPKHAAEFLGCSTTQLVGLLRDESKAFALVNSKRSQRGLHVLK